VSIALLGHPLGEAIIPLLVLTLVAAIGWQLTWVLVAGLLALAVAPALALLLARGRVPEGDPAGGSTPGIGGRHWTRADVLSGWQFWAILPVIISPGFIGTVVFFQQAHIAEVRGWSLAAMATGYPVYAAMTVLSALAAGWAADRFGVLRLLPFALVPMGLGIGLIGVSPAISGWIVALALIGPTQGIASTVWGVVVPSLYGTRHLGSVRALVVTMGVISSALGPGVTGLLIDAGIDFPRQAVVMAGWCAALSIAAVPIHRRLRAEAAAG
jgi:MFS family permease